MAAVSAFDDTTYTLIQVLRYWDENNRDTAPVFSITAISSSKISQYIRQALVTDKVFVEYTEIK